MENAWAYVLLVAIIWVICNVSTTDSPKRNTSSALGNNKLNGRVPLAKRKSKLVQCVGNQAHVPKYKRSQELTRRAQDLAASVALGKQAIAAHMEARRKGVCNGKCSVSTIIAGVVRDRKTLKNLEWDQPF